MSKKYPSKDDGSLNGLSRYKQIEWVWNYYKIPIIAAIIVVFLAVYYIMHLMSLNRDAISILVCNVYTADQGATDNYLNTAFNEFIQDENNGKLPLEFDHALNYDTENEENNITMIQKFTAVIASKSTQMMLTDQLVIDHFGSQGMFEDLQNWLPEEMYKEFENNDMLGYVTIPADHVDPEHTYAAVIKIGQDQTQILTDAGFFLSDTTVIAIPVGAKHHERTLNFLRMLLDKKYVTPVAE